ncbi:hypothetical protein [Vibrio sp. HN007]|uniref:hypothetical protein n=1 Tax=Vibrio iocasae TaxID=3098914 RepID=UPI0035D4F243
MNMEINEIRCAIDDARKEYEQGEEIANSAERLLEAVSELLDCMQKADTGRVLERISQLEQSVALSYSKAGRNARPDLADKQLQITSELDGLYFSLGKKRPKFACDDFPPTRFR